MREYTMKEYDKHGKPTGREIKAYDLLAPSDKPPKQKRKTQGGEGVTKAEFYKILDKASQPVKNDESDED
jgi:hypothetical protein